jgi:vitamin B12 transporter
MMFPLYPEFREKTRNISFTQQLCAATAVVLLSGLPPEPIQAEKNDSTRVVVSATRAEAPLEDVGSSITVVDGESIEVSGKDTVLEVLRALSGVTVTQVGGPGHTATVFLRGAESDHTMVMINGVRVNTGTTGIFDFSALKTDNVERIEILRGPQSVLYGSEAVGGVIHIITRSAKEGTRLRATASGGSHGTQEYSVTAEHGDEQVNSSTTVSFFDTEGISVANEKNGNPEEDSHSNFTLTTRNSVPFSDDGELSVAATYTHSESELDNFAFGVGAVDALHAETERDFVTAAISIRKPLSEWIVPTIEIGATDDDTKGTDPETEYNNYTIDNTTVYGNGRLEIIPSDATLVVTGYTFEERTGENKGNFDENRDVHSVFANVQQKFGRLTVGAGLRFDEDSQFGNETTYRATFSFPLESGTRFHGSAGTAFKAPSFNELYFPNYGVPTLNPETSKGYDLGVEQSFCDGEGKADLTAFYNEVDDLISFDSTTFLAANISEVETYGVEASFSYQLSENIYFTSSYTYTDSEDQTSGAQLARRPKHSGYVEFISSPVENLDLSLRAYTIYDRVESDGSILDDYTRVDLAASYQATEHLKPFLRIENLFDEEYEEVSGYGTPGFVVFAGFSVES